MKLGRFEISTHVLGHFRLDGGAMFGSVPKNIWAKKIPADDENCIALATRSLLISDGERRFLVDVGCGEKWEAKPRAIFAIRNRPVAEWGFDPAQITDVILTHLHFDHAGGISYFSPDGNLKLAFPQARVHLQADNFRNASAPTLKERASYLKDNVEILKSADLNLVDGSTEIHPGIWVHRVDGHTLGQQVVEARTGEGSVYFATDLIPTAHHLPLAFHMGYDVCAETLMREKAEFLEKLANQDAIIVFQHDKDVAAGRVGLDDRGQYCLASQVQI